MQDLNYCAGAVLPDSNNKQNKYSLNFALHRIAALFE